MADSLRFLVLCAYFPWHGHGGGVIVGNMLRQLAVEHSVTVLSYCSTTELQHQYELFPPTDLFIVPTPDQRLNSNGVHTDSPASDSQPGLLRRSWQKMPQPVRSGVYVLRWLLKQIYQYKRNPYPAELYRLQSQAFQARLDMILSEQSFDIILSEWPEMGDYGLQGGKEVLKVLDTIEMRSLTYARAIKNDPRLDARISSWFDWHKMRAYEKRMCAEYDIVTTVSNREASIFSQYGGRAAILHNPIGLELDNYAFVGQEQRKPNQIIFLGNLLYGPNQDAVKFFISHIYPRIRLQVPEVEFWITGNAPSQDLLKLSGTQGITVTGYVPDVKQYLNESSVFVLPMRQGAGIKIKALEAMATGLPVVSTPEGMEGIKIDDECFICDHDQDFADQVVRLISDTSLRQAMAEKARALMVEGYDCRKNVAEMVAVYRKALTEKKCA